MNGPILVAYRHDLIVTNFDSIGPGRGAKYLECIRSHEGTLVAKAWRRKIPPTAEVVVTFG